MPTSRIQTALFALTVVICSASSGWTQTRVPAPEPPSRSAGGTVQPAVPTLPAIEANELRQQFREVMRTYPPSLGRVLKLDPTLMSSDAYLAQYPVLAGFLAAHPEIKHNPGYFLDFIYLEGEPQPTDARTESVRMYRNMIEWMMGFTIAVTVASLVAWFVRTFIDYRRWLRVSRVQTEVHNKLLDRFASTNELMTYVQTSAGRRFLESAPIPLDPGPSSRPLGAPFSRILWSVQVGVVLVVGGLGFQYVKGGMIEEVAQPLALMGVLATAFGMGFILSGLASYLLSRRLGLLDPVAVPPATERTDPTAS
jgi:hypothetical protein